MADFRFFKMAAVRHLEFVLRVLDHPRRALVTMLVLMFCEFGLKMHIHVPFWVVFVLRIM